MTIDNNSGNSGRIIYCSFCGKSQNDVEKIVAGSGAFICNECIALCSNVAMSKGDSNIKKQSHDAFHAYANEPGIASLKHRFLTPSQIVKKLDEYVVGQDYAKKILAVNVYNHYKRINCDPNDHADVEISKSNVLLIGSTGSGKTLLAKTLANIIDVPFAIADATSLTEAGYVGEDVETIVLKLLQAADYNIEAAQKGIIYIDEVDKITRKSDSSSITRDVSGEGVQQALLKIIEGSVAFVSPQNGRKHPQQEFLRVDTTNILFICGGAFCGLDKIIDKRSSSTGIGFGANIEDKDAPKKAGDLFKKIEVQDLVRYGLIPEFVGRLPVVATLDDLDEKALLSILCDPKDALLKQYTALLKMNNTDLVFDEDAKHEIVRLAMERKTGARGLRSIMESILLDIMYSVPDNNAKTTITITRDVVLGSQDALMNIEEVKYG